MLIKNRYLILSRDVLLFGRFYFKTRSLLKNIDKWSKEQVEEYQTRNLKKILVYSFNHVPYYHKLFKEINFNPEDFKHPEEIKIIPFLTKEIIRNNTRQLISDNIPEKYHKYSITGGTTGTPLDLYLDRRTSSPVEFAYMNYIWKKVGYRFYDRCAVLRADMAKTGNNENKYWHFNMANNWLTFSSHNLNSTTSELYIHKILKFKPKFIIAYPSVVYLLARYVEQAKVKFPFLRAIICSSETLYPWQREYLKKVFDTEVFSYYGLTEKCCLAGECTTNTYYKFVPAYGYTELVNTANEWCNYEDEEGEIIATGLNNFLMPLIRYKTNDIGVFTNYTDNSPGWQIIKEIRGRKQEFFVDKTGSAVSFTCSDEPFWHIIDKINAYQYIQDIPGIVELNLDINKKLTNQETGIIKKAFNSYYNNIELKINLVDAIPRTKSGKFRFLIQNTTSVSK